MNNKEKVIEMLDSCLNLLKDDQHAYTLVITQDVGWEPKLDYCVDYRSGALNNKMELIQLFCGSIKILAKLIEDLQALEDNKPIVPFDDIEFKEVIYQNEEEH